MKWHLPGTLQRERRHVETPCPYRGRSKTRDVFRVDSVVDGVFVLCGTHVGLADATLACSSLAGAWGDAGLAGIHTIRRGITWVH